MLNLKFKKKGGRHRGKRKRRRDRRKKRGNEVKKVLRESLLYDKSFLAT